MKFLFPILLITSVIAKNNSNQAYYTIYTSAKSYKNVMLHLVQGNDLVFNEQNSTKKYTIPIPYINGIKTTEGRQTPLENSF